MYACNLPSQIYQLICCDCQSDICHKNCARVVSRVLVMLQREWAGSSWLRAQLAVYTVRGAARPRGAGPQAAVHTRRCMY